jgi:hypothetical protein
MESESNHHYIISWTEYGNGHSGVKRYSIGDDFIWLDFGSAEVYQYNYEVTGEQAVEQLKIFARLGTKLTTVLNVGGMKSRYSKKIDKSKIH